MVIHEMELEGVYLIKPDVFEDHRGFFIESYNRIRLAEHSIHDTFIQDNHSLSVEKGTLRGLHYQLKPRAQTKLIRVISGAVYDVVVDIRKNSPTYCQWIAVTLTAENHQQILVPKGFAHGFCTLEPNTQVVYKVDELYSREHERGFAWNDPDLNIPWPCNEPPILSDKDNRYPRQNEAENNFIWRPVK